jgi:hypothetical protein
VKANGTLADGVPLPGPFPIEMMPVGIIRNKKIDNNPIKD